MAQATTTKAKTDKTTFSRTTAVSIDIKADPAIIWKLLTNGNDYTRWNSTLISMEGKIALGETIKLVSKLAPKRAFKLKIKEFDPMKTLVWGDGQGQRVFTIVSTNNGLQTFDMTEKIGGFVFPLYAKYIPSFDASFEQFATDLKAEAEAIQNTAK